MRDDFAHERWLGPGVLLVTALLYAASLGGDWVWDDIPQFRDNPAITSPWILVTHDIWGPTGQAQPGNTPVYRPLAMLTHVPGQRWLPGPAVERIVNLALHLAIALGVASLARSLGASRRAAWFGAALLAWHPAATESVAWISCRGELLGTGLVLGGLLALARQRDVSAGLLFALAPFCKETFVLAPATLAIYWLALPRRSPGPLLLSMGGAAVYLALRSGLGIALPQGSGASGLAELLGAVGALALRGLTLVALPTAPDALPPFVSHPLVGGFAIALALPALAWLPGRPWLATLLGGLPLLALAAPASLANGVVSDRYFYAAASLLAVGAALLFAALERAPRPAWARLTPALAALPLLCLPFAAWRALDWQSNESLFGASLAKAPDNPEAQFRVAHHLHTARGDCEAALPLYTAAMRHNTRAANNLQACLLELGRVREAATLGPQLVVGDPDNPTPALNTARALRHLGNLAGAERFAREGVRRQPTRAPSHVLLGEILGEQGRHAAARLAFEHALELDPTLSGARQGIATAERHLGRLGGAG